MGWIQAGRMEVGMSRLFVPYRFGPGAGSGRTKRGGAPLRPYKSKGEFPAGYNFGKRLSTTASVGTRPLSPSFISAGAGPVFSGALW